LSDLLINRLLAAEECHLFCPFQTVIRPIPIRRSNTPDVGKPRALVATAWPSAAIVLSPGSSLRTAARQKHTWIQ
jgi:hypothetical protein